MEVYRPSMKVLSFAGRSHIANFRAAQLFSYEFGPTAFRRDCARFGFFEGRVEFEPILPYALSFPAGVMIFMVVEEVIPETQQDKYTDIATTGFIGGFIIMMILDVGLGKSLRFELQHRIIPQVVFLLNYQA